MILVKKNKKNYIHVDYENYIHVLQGLSREEEDITAITYQILFGHCVGVC